MKPKDKIIHLIRQIKNFPENTIALATHIKMDLHLDSIDFMHLIILLEDCFEIYLSNEDIEQIETVGDAHEMIILKLNVSLFSD